MISIIITELKNPRNIMIIICIIIGYMFYANSQKKITEITTTYESRISSLVLTHTKDSTSITEKSYKIDSLNIIIKKHYDSTVTTTNTKTGKSTKTTTLTTKDSTGKTSTTIIVDTFDGVDNTNANTKVNIDENTEIHKKEIETLNTEISTLKEKLNLKNNDSTTSSSSSSKTVTPVEKKLELSASIGADVNYDNSFNINPIILLGARYDIINPVFIESDVMKTGNLLNYGTIGDYKLGAKIGVHFKF